MRSNALNNGQFMVNVVKAGRYRITPMRWPAYVDEPSGCTGVSLSIMKRNGAQGSDWSTNPDEPVRSKVIELQKGPASLTTTLTREDGKEFGAYYLKIEYLDEE